MTKREGVYAFGTSEGWDSFQVARLHGVEEISKPYAFEIILLRANKSGPADLDALLNAPASLRMATKDKWRTIHGIVSEAEELDRTPTQFAYRVLLAPPIVRARHRRRCRNFVDKTLEDILKTVLENRSPAYPNGNVGLAELNGDPAAPEDDPSFTSFSEPKGYYKIALSDGSRLTDATVAPYIVQYNESDFDFLSRLLEREGISYTFEHAADGVIMVLTDAPGQSPLITAPTSLEMRSRIGLDDAHASEEFVKRLRDARRLRSGNASVRQFDWHRSLQVLEANEKATDDDPDAFGAYEFTNEDEELGSNPGAVPAKVRVERQRVERELRDGTGSVRTMEAGRRYNLQDTDQLHDEVELLIVRVETRAAALFPQDAALDALGAHGARGTGGTPNHEAHFTALPSSVPFRPEQRTKKRLIHGVQTALVTAEEFSGSPPEINADKFGSVRVRFPWDQRKNTDDGTPSSHWIRVSQYWAGISYGALHTPRVGHEVLVAYYQGDPDRPVIVGRVYNAQNPPPYDPSKEPTKSTVKSKSSPKSQGFNEFRFEDKAGSEEVFLHAQKDLNEVVLSCHSTSVGADQSNTVGHNQSNTVHNNRSHKVDANEDCVVLGNRTHTVAGTEDVCVGGDRTTTFGANETHTVAANETRTIGANRTTTVGATDQLTTSMRITTVAGSDKSIVGGADSVTVGGARTVTVGGAYGVQSANYSSAAAGSHTFESPSFEVTSDTASFNQSASFTVVAGGATLVMMPGIVFISNGAGASVALVGGIIVADAGALMVHKAGGLLFQKSGGPIINEASGPFNAKGSVMNLVAGGDVNVTGATIRLNG